MARTGYASAAAISGCAIARHPCDRPQNSKSQKQNQTQIPCASPSPLEKTVEADISIWRKTGHFYFALTPMSKGVERKTLLKKILD